MNAYTTQDRIRFTAKIDFPVDANGCWTWTGAKHGQGRGYGKFKLGGKTVSAHKAGYLMFEGNVAAGMVVNHMCVNEACVNPHHLNVCTQSDNIKYSIICGTHNSCKGKV